MKFVIKCNAFPMSVCAYQKRYEKDINFTENICEYSGYCEFQRPRDDRKEIEVEE